jgi:hypothetical protein
MPAGHRFAPPALPKDAGSPLPKAAATSNGSLESAGTPSIKKRS